MLLGLLAILSLAVGAKSNMAAQEYHVTIPEEVHAIVQFKQDELPGVAVVNSALVEFEPKVVFSWHFSMLIDAKDLGENGMPTPEEQQVLYDFEDTIDPVVKAQGNALFLARVTHDGQRQLIYRVHSPEPLNDYLQGLIKSKNHQREFDYRIEPDGSWELAKWYLNAVSR